MLRENSTINYPLQDVKSYDPLFKVESRLHEAHWKNVFTEDEITLEVLSICCQLEFLCKKCYTKGKGDIHVEHKMEFLNKFKPHARVEFQKINEQLKLLSYPQPSINEFMKKKGLDLLFPKIWTYIRDPEKPYFHNQKSFLSNYFERLSAMNQLKMMSQQINMDLHNLVNHKYMAHQSALLYHAIAELGSPLKTYKEQVEEMFPDIKKGLKVGQGQIPHLPMQEKVKMDTLTTALTDMVSNFHANVSQPLTPFINFMQNPL
ncbi:uncharacterized protein LOC130636081 [Hydractinia symbiolongicarpus]|uniref:uncharacterized protein LOC130636081 n=1 Tax=Hydractinia symbiolongicarpus TaxID=13093 RepID=UPI00254C5B8C|nr:uncharacterized protein LOC130636081 [Hydractinia symbiolongicarpus]XP_057301660.1 uncharacterized protein LOC130636081 [Hydractinia symbiolongicarpus]